MHLQCIKMFLWSKITLITGSGYNVLRGSYGGKCPFRFWLQRFNRINIWATYIGMPPFEESTKGNDIKLGL